jgi:hypothetical protein
MSRTQQMIGVSALLVVAVLVTYGQVLGHGFINLDDDQYVTANSMVEYLPCIPRTLNRSRGFPNAKTY